MKLLRVCLAFIMLTSVVMCFACNGNTENSVKTPREVKAVLYEMTDSRYETTYAHAFNGTETKVSLITEGVVLSVRIPHSNEIGISITLIYKGSGVDEIKGAIQYRDEIPSSGSYILYTYHNISNHSLGNFVSKELKVVGTDKGEEAPSENAQINAIGAYETLAKDAIDWFVGIIYQKTGVYYI